MVLNAECEIQALNGRLRTWSPDSGAAARQRTRTDESTHRQSSAYIRQDPGTAPFNITERSIHERFSLPGCCFLLGAFQLILAFVPAEQPH